ncbi:MAG TPA: IS200/IS605 family transposase [Acidobacteriota bacterium]|nr:IS200/IS605 family transposase [Acidobacteriota bacterium]
MPQSPAQIWPHIIFSTKERYPFFKKPALQEEVFAYLSEVCGRIECPAAITGGHRDHVHVLCRQSKNISTSQLVGTLKRHSSKWIKSKGGILSKFFWQAGYGAFSVGPSQLPMAKDYIRNQEAHHQRVDIKSEFRAFLDRYDISYDDKHLWD